MLRKYQVIGFAFVIGLLAAGFAQAKPKTPKASTPGNNSKSSSGGAVPSTSTPTADPAAPLPDSLARTLKETFPGATIGSWTNVTDNGLALYSVEIRIGAVLKTVDIAIDTSIAKVATLVPIGEAPEVVANTLRDADEKAIVTRVQKVEVQAEVKAADPKIEGDKPKLVTLEKFKYYYAGRLFKDGKPGHMTVAEDGKVMTALAWEGKPVDTSTNTTNTKTSTPAKKK